MLIVADVVVVLVIGMWCVLVAVAIAIAAVDVVVVVDVIVVGYRDVFLVCEKQRVVGITVCQGISAFAVLAASQSALSGFRT
jgi:hypothetical protein